MFENTPTLDLLHLGKLHKAVTIELIFEELGCCVTSQANRCQSKSQGKKQTNESEKHTGAVHCPPNPEMFLSPLQGKNNARKIILRF